MLSAGRARQPNRVLAHDRGDFRALYGKKSPRSWAFPARRVRGERMRGQELVCVLGEVGFGDRAAVGGKGASLGELARVGFPVPAGYVVTVAAFGRALRALDPAGTIRREIEELPADDTAAIARVSARVRARIAAAEPPGEVRAPVVAGYRVLGGGAVAEEDGADRGDGEPGVAVAVRSSATGEDGREASFAG